MIRIFLLTRAIKSSACLYNIWFYLPTNNSTYCIMRFFHITTAINACRNFGSNSQQLVLILNSNTYWIIRIFLHTRAIKRSACLYNIWFCLTFGTKSQKKKKHLRWEFKFFNEKKWRWPLSHMESNGHISKTIRSIPLSRPEHRHKKHTILLVLSF